MSLEQTEAEQQNSTSQQAPETPESQQTSQQSSPEGEDKGFDLDALRKKAEESNVEADAPKEGEPEATASPSDEPTEGQSFQPDYKFTVLDKEHEVDEFLREAIKDEESQKKVKELYEKAYGLDHVKDKLKTTREEFQGTKKEYDQLVGDLQILKAHVDRGDLDSFFRGVGVSEDTVLQWVLDKVKYEQMGPEQRQIIDAQRQAEQRAFQAETQYSQTQRQLEQQAAQNTALEIKTVLAQPTVKDFAERFDSAAGKGAFVEQMLIQGEMMYDEKTGQAPPAAKVAEVLMGRFKNLVMQPTQGQQPAAQPAQQTPSAGGTQTPPVNTKPKENVIPNVSGRNASAVKQEVRSIDDLRKLAASMG